MRPLELTITGLHSYREPVTVDFESLGRFGLFGIFGKIGSGKSTLLDGITLALYGLVDRVATRSRRGLVNLGSDRCEVRLRFAVDGAGGRTEVYEVHRAYREVDGVAQRVASRLTRVSAGRESARLVIAEKEAEVTSAVTEIVGLGAEDFMRAVVLPQGRFAQLLHLKGQERRQMLQRIFRLQAYGETLRKQVRDRLDATRAAVASIKGELAGLGDASASVVRAAEQTAIDARATRNEAERVLAEVAQVHGAAARARELWQRATEARSELDRHLASAAIQAARLARVEVAEKLRPLVEPVRRWQIAAEASLAADQARAVAGARASEAAAAEQVAREEAERVRAARAEREPGLRRLLVRLEQVERWQVELAEERERYTAAAVESTEARAAAAEAVTALAEGRVRSAELDAERRRLRREYNKVRVAAEERETVLRASRAADRIHAARRRSEEAHAAEDQARAEVARREAELASVEQARTAAAARHAAAEGALRAAEAAEGWIPEAERAEVAARAAEAERWAALATSHRAAVAEAQQAAADAHTTRVAAELAHASASAERAAADQVLRGAEKALARAEAALEAARDQAAAAALARALESGVPCAVCGSPHHPAPATAPSELPTAPVEAHRAGREKATRRQEAAIAELGRAAAALEAARAAEKAANERKVAVERALAETEGPIAAGAEARARLLAHQAAHQAVEHALAALRAAATELDRSAVPAAAAAAALEAAREGLARAVATRAARAVEEGEAFTQFERDRGTATLLDVSVAAGAIEARDRRAEAAQTALEKIEVAQQALEERVAAARIAQDNARSALERSAERLEATGHRITSLEGQIRAEIGERGTAEIGAEAREALAALEAAASAAESALTERAATAYERRREADHRASVARSAELERSEAERVVGRWPDAPSLDRIADWLASVPDEAAAAAWRREAAEWQERRVVLETRVHALADPGGPSPLDDATFAASAERLAEATDRAERARDEASAAARWHEEVASKAGRHAELSARSDALDRELTRLDELTVLLRGDRFVEFVANDHLVELTARAGLHLSELTSGRYSLELDEESAFVVRDGDAGGALRPVHTLSGGESFLTALSLALALSTKVQERSARPLGFFFLDEGFGTLDPESIDRVLTAIERLRDNQRLIGLISHVQAIRERVPRYLWVHADTGSGSSVEMQDN